MCLGLDDRPARGRVTASAYNSNKAGVIIGAASMGELTKAGSIGTGRLPATFRYARMNWALPLVAALGVVACGDGRGYRVKADLGSALIVVANASLNREEFVRIARDVCAERSICQARIWTDDRWAPQDTTWPPGAREHVAMIFNRYPGSDGDFHRWNCRRYPTVAPAQCIPF